MVALYVEWCRQYPIISIEDGCAEGDWRGWAMLTRELGSRVQLVGDDVFVTNPEILARGITEGVANALLVKLNQIGTVTETLDAIAMASKAGYASVDLTPLGRNRGFDHRRPRGRHRRRPNQDRLRVAQRPHGEVQPAAAHRRRARRGRQIRGPERQIKQLVVRSAV